MTLTDNTYLESNDVYEKLIVGNFFFSFRFFLLLLLIIMILIIIQQKKEYRFNNYCQQTGRRREYHDHINKERKSSTPCYLISIYSMKLSDEVFYCFFSSEREKEERSFFFRFQMITTYFD